MERRKQLLRALALAAMAGLICLALRVTGVWGVPTPRKAMLARTEEMIDSETLEVIAKTNAEWEDLGRNEKGYYKHPVTGKYTVTFLFPCPQCGTKLPRAADSPAHFKCPKCGATVSPP